MKIEIVDERRSLLLLDTAEGGGGERLGWQEIGRVPDHFVDPSGMPRTSIYFMRHLGTDRDRPNA